MNQINSLPGNRLDVRGAAAYLGCSESSLNRMRSQGRGPRYMRGTRIWYRPTDLDAWLAARTVETADTRGAA